MNRAVRISPTWGVPVGDGQNRTRTGVSAVTGGIREALVMMPPSLAAPVGVARIKHDAGTSSFALGPPWVCPPLAPGFPFRQKTLDAVPRPGVIYNQMVVDQLRDEEADRLFQAFSDSTRRDIVRRVSAESLSISALAVFYTMSFAAVQKHVAVLERAALVTKEKRGREQLVHANHEGLARARALLDEYETIWRERFSRIANILAEETATEQGDESS